MKTFGQFIREARKSAGLTQKEMAERLRRSDGRKVLPPFVNDLEFDRRTHPRTQWPAPRKLRQPPASRPRQDCR
jgi:transcriptional regulator with XRE-family HTH domain